MHSHQCQSIGVSFRYFLSEGNSKGNQPSRHQILAFTESCTSPNAYWKEFFKGDIEIRSRTNRRRKYILNRKRERKLKTQKKNQRKKITVRIIEVMNLGNEGERDESWFIKIFFMENPSDLRICRTWNLLKQDTSVFENIFPPVDLSPL